MLESALYSLREVVIPAIDDDWALYVAKCMDKLLVNARDRIRSDIESLSRDTQEIEALLTELDSELSALGQPAIDAVLAGPPAEPPVDAELAQGLVAAIHEANVTARERLSQVIRGLFDAQDSASDGDELERVISLHDRVRDHLDRQLERDVSAMSSVFMAFGAPPAATGKKEGR